MVGTSLLLGYLAPNIGIVLSILGSVSNPIICFILPCLFSIRLQSSPQPLAWTVLVLAILLSLLSFTLVLISY